MLVLNAADLSTLIGMRACIEAVEEGFRALARGEAAAPERLHLEIPSSGGVLLAMPAYSTSQTGQGVGPRAGALGTKIVTVFAGNAGRGLDLVQAIYLLLDEQTGQPLAVMEGRFITAIRTAATSAVATKYMAPPGPKRLAIFGAGVQGQFHIDAMTEVARIDRVLIVSRSAERAHKLRDRTRSLYRVECEVVKAEEAVADSNLICTCTSAGHPLFDGRLVRPGTHINAVGAFTPSTRELDTEAVRRARVIIDAHSAAGREAGEILIPLGEGAIKSAHVSGTLAELVSGSVEGRGSVEEITLFKSCGLALEDLVTARLAYAEAKAQRVGVEVSI